MQIKTAVIHHYVPTTIVKMKNTDNTNNGENEEKRDHSYMACGNVAMVQPLWKLFWQARFGPKAIVCGCLLYNNT